jgi:phosphatidate cytidylyltransferase
VLRTRIWTALVALPAALAAIIFAPDWFFTWFIGALTAWGLYEVGAMTAAHTFGPLVMLIVAGAAPALALLYAGDRGWIMPAIVVVAMLALIARVAIDAGGGGRGDGRPWLTLLGALWVGELFPYFALLRNRGDGVKLVVLLLLLVAASDSGAYFVGTWLGRIKLLPKVSPNKTLEGALAGLVSSAIAGLVLYGLLVPGWSLLAVVVSSIMVSLLAQLGDLAGSAFKRVAGVKDSGWVFPGHGGLLDRTCSLVFAAVFAYYYSQ